MTRPRGSGREAFKISRVGLDRVTRCPNSYGSGWVGSGRVRRVLSYHGSIRVSLRRPDPTREQAYRRLFLTLQKNWLFQSERKALHRNRSLNGGRGFAVYCVGFLTNMNGLCQPERAQFIAHHERTRDFFLYIASAFCEQQTAWFNQKEVADVIIMMKDGGLLYIASAVLRA
ncbi:unnamed protein product [Laminaria digitata]